MDKNKPQVSLKQVYDSISHNAEISGVSVNDKIQLKNVSIDEYILNKVIFKNCIINALEGDYLFYDDFVILERCSINIANFAASFFSSGCEIRECIFYNDLNLLSMGGHNKPDMPIIISDCVFHGFVNFIDAWFGGPVEITKCHFLKGTNLLGNKGQPFVVMFSVPPIISENIGSLDKNGGDF